MRSVVGQRDSQSISRCGGGGMEKLKSVSE